MATRSRCFGRRVRRRRAGAAPPRAASPRPGRATARAPAEPGSTARRTALPSLGARRVAVVGEQDVAGRQAAREPRQHVGRLAPHGVEAAPRPADELQVEALQHRRRNGLRSPAGARKKRGASPVMSASDACAAAISRAIAFGPSSEKRREWRSLWFCTLWPRRDDLAAQGRVGTRLAPMQKKVAFAPCASSRSRTAGVTAGSGPSSMVIAISRRAAACAGRRVQLLPEPARARPEAAGGERDVVGGDRGRAPTATTPARRSRAGRRPRARRGSRVT